MVTSRPSSITLIGDQIVTTDFGDFPRSQIWRGGLSEFAPAAGVSYQAVKQQSQVGSLGWLFQIEGRKYETHVDSVTNWRENVLPQSRLLARQKNGLRGGRPSTQRVTKQEKA